MTSSGTAGGATTAPALQPAADFRLTFADGAQYALPPPEGGWARAQRMPSVRSTPPQIEFIFEAYTISDHPRWAQVKFSAATARELMEKVGTAEVATAYASHPYFGVDLGRRRFGRLDVLDTSKIKGYFGKGPKALKKLHENAQQRGVVDEEEDGEGGVGLVGGGESFRWSGGGN